MQHCLTHPLLLAILCSVFSASPASPPTDVATITIGQEPTPCTSQDSSRMILDKNRFLGTKQMNGKWIRRSEIRARLKTAQDERCRQLYRRGVILQGPVYGGLCLIAVAMMSTDLPGPIPLSTLIGATALTLLGTSMKNHAIDRYNNQFCSNPHAATLRARILISFPIPALPPSERTLFFKWNRLPRSAEHRKCSHYQNS